MNKQCIKPVAPSGSLSTEGIIITQVALCEGRKFNEKKKAFCAPHTLFDSCMEITCFSTLV